jgi:hypothetical protein
VANVHDEAVTRLDSAVSEVFETMLARSCDPLDGEVDTVDGRIVARIQFTGAVDGECLLYASQATASVTAEQARITGFELFDLHTGRDPRWPRGLSSQVRNQVQPQLLVSGKRLWGCTRFLGVPLPHTCE